MGHYQITERTVYTSTGTVANIIPKLRNQFPAYVKTKSVLEASGKVKAGVSSTMITILLRKYLIKKRSF